MKIKENVIENVFGLKDFFEDCLSFYKGKRNARLIIIIYGIPNYSKKKLKEFRKNLRESINYYPELKLKPSMITIFLSREKLKGFEQDIVIFIEGYCYGPDCLMNSFSKKIKDTAEDFFLESPIDCLSIIFNPEKERIYHEPKDWGNADSIYHERGGYWADWTCKNCGRKFTTPVPNIVGQ